MDFDIHRSNKSEKLLTFALSTLLMYFVTLKYTDRLTHTPTHSIDLEVGAIKHGTMGRAGGGSALSWVIFTL